MPIETKDFGKKTKEKTVKAPEPKIPLTPRDLPVDNKSQKTPTPPQKIPLPVKRANPNKESGVFNKLRIVILLALVILIARLALSGFMYLRQTEPIPDITPALEAAAFPAAASPALLESASPGLAEAGLTAAQAAGGAMLAGASIFFSEGAAAALTAAADPALSVAAQAGIPLPPDAEGLRRPQSPLLPPAPLEAQSQGQSSPSSQQNAQGTPPSAPQTSTGATADELARREFDLNRREVQLNAREAALKELEGSVNERIRTAELKEKDINELILRNDAILAEQKAQREEQQKADDMLKSARVEHLVAAFKSMKPEQAALLINSMEDGVAVALLTAMPGRNAGLVLGMVAPEKAARLVKAISEQRIDPRVLLENAELNNAAQQGG
jgi:flagellar motility protein MotE (MotC chaperone)